jgi:hypothetical protein
MTHEDAIHAVQERTYTAASEGDLRAMIQACMDIHGPNPVAHHRVTHAAEILRQELQLRFLSGERTWQALIQSVEELTRVAPQDHDVFLVTDDIRVVKADFLRPHSFRFEGIDQHGHRTGIVVHFSQLKARVVYLPKRDTAAPRIITGFADGRVA